MCRKCKGKDSGIAHDVATGIGGLHKAADALFWPLKPVDDVIHGVARGTFNWLTDQHPRHEYSSESECDSPPRQHKSKPYGGGGYPEPYPHGAGYPYPYPHDGGFPYPRSYGGGYPSSMRDEFSGNRGRNIGNGNVNNEGGLVKDSGKVSVGSPQPHPHGTGGYPYGPYPHHYGGGYEG